MGKILNVCRNVAVGTAAVVAGGLGIELGGAGANALIEDIKYVSGKDYTARYTNGRIFKKYYDSHFREVKYNKKENKWQLAKPAAPKAKKATTKKAKKA